MKVITNVKELFGKKIAYIHTARYFDCIVIVTEDKEIFMCRSYIDEEEDCIATEILPESQVLKIASTYNFLREEMLKLGVFDVEDYILKRQEEFKKKQQERKAKELERERALYEQLKAKFESNEV